MHVESFSRAFVIHNLRTKPGRENASFRVYSGLLTASTNASVSVRLRWLHGTRSRNERALLFNPLNSSGLWHSRPALRDVKILR